jgi:cytoskeletal protein RodZ
MAVKLEAQRLWLARVLFVAALGVLVALAGAATARAAGPERPPVKAAPRIGPEPAPVAQTTAPRTRTSSASTSTSTTTSSTSQTSSTATSRPAIASTASAPPQQRPATSARPKRHAPPPAPPKATHRVKAAARSLAHTIQRPAASIALVAAPGGTSDSNRLLFLGGLALLVLVLGDATFLAVSARVIRDQR